jgi:hypothetical protein
LEPPRQAEIAHFFDIFQVKGIRMIAPALIAEIKRLLTIGKSSQRKIATQMSVSRGTVSGIANGTRPDYEARRREREQEESLLPTGPLERCPGCGGMAYMPCQLCHIRQIKADRQRRKLLVRQQIERLTSHRWLPPTANTTLPTAKRLLPTATPGLPAGKPSLPTGTSHQAADHLARTDHQRSVAAVG